MQNYTREMNQARYRTANTFTVDRNGIPSLPVKPGDHVTAVIFDVTGHPITAARNYGKVYEVKEQGDKLGIDWNDGQAAEIYGAFAPFASFSHDVQFTLV